MADTKKVVVKIDPSAAKDSSCLLRTYYTVVKGYGDVLNKAEMEYGNALHRFLEHWYNTGGEFALGMAKGVEYFNSKQPLVSEKAWMMQQDHLVATMLGYQKAYPYAYDPIRPLSKEDGTTDKAVEIKFAIPYMTYTASDGTIVEVVLCGTIDVLGLYGPRYAIVDHKSTGQWKEQQFINNFRMSCQFMIYMLAIKRLAELQPNSVYGRIIREQIEIGFVINAIFLKADSANTKYLRNPEPIYYAPDQLAEIKLLLDMFALNVAKMVGGDFLPLREGMLNGACQTPYGVCKYFNACSSGSVEEREVVLAGSFTRREYDPMKFGGAS